MLPRNRPESIDAPLRDLRHGLRSELLCVQPSCNHYATNVRQSVATCSNKSTRKTANQNANFHETATHGNRLDQTQNLLPVREWGFKSLHPHQSHVRSQNARDRSV